MQAVTGSEVVLRRGAGPATRVDDLRTLLEEHVGDVHRLIENPARVSPQVKQEPLHSLLLEPLDRGLQLAARGVGEVGEQQVTGVGGHHEGVPHRKSRDLGARDRHPERFVDPGAPNRDRDLAALGPAQLADDLIRRDVFLDLLVLDVRDHVARPDPELEGGRPFHRGDDRDPPHSLLDLDPEAEERALLLLAHRGEVFRLQEGGVGIEPGQHSVDRRVDELIRRDRLRRPLGERRQDVGVLVEGWALALRRSEEDRREGSSGEGRRCEKGDGDDESGAAWTQLGSS